MVQDFVHQYVPLPSWGLKWSNDLDDLGALRPVAVAEERFVVLGVVRSPPPPPPGPPWPPWRAQRVLCQAGKKGRLGSQLGTLRISMEFRSRNNGMVWVLMRSY